MSNDYSPSTATLEAVSQLTNTLREIRGVDPARFEGFVSGMQLALSAFEVSAQLMKAALAEVAGE